MSKVIDFFQKATSKSIAGNKTSASRTVENLLADRQPEAFPTDDFFFDGNPQSCFIVHAGNDYCLIQQGDVLIVRVGDEPRPTDYIVHDWETGGNVLKFSEWDANQHSEIVGVVLRIIRRVDL